MSQEDYVETFEGEPGGWIGYDKDGAAPLEIQEGAAVSSSPWWVDYNHAPPGGGYLHLLFVLYTTRPQTQGARTEGTVPNRFVKEGYPTDFRDATITARLRGELESRGAELRLLAQAEVGDRHLNHVLTDTPFKVTSDWSEQSVTLTPDPDRWTCLGSRHDRTDFYGWGSIEDVLRDLNVDLIFVLHPLDIAPAEPIDEDPHRLRAGEDYPVDRSRLPEGHVMLDELRVEFADRVTDDRTEGA